jgi:hypothetical protein
VRPSEREQHTGVNPIRSVTGDPMDSLRPGRARISSVSTRTLLILAAVTGVAILAAGAVQILLAR